MDPRALNIKKIEQFKKEIRQEQLEQKKESIRRNLPYYKPMFQKPGEDSNGNSSKSSRFSAPQKKTNHQTEQEIQLSETVQKKENFWGIDTTTNEIEKQVQYIEYLINLNQKDDEETRSFISRVMVQRYGDNCFEFMDQLRDQIYINLLDYEFKVLQGNQVQSLWMVDWDFWLAAFYLAENQNYTEILNLSFSLITKSFMIWYHKNIEKEIEPNSQEIDFFYVLAQEASVSLLNHLFWRSSLDQEMILTVIEIYEKVINVTVKLGLTKQLIYFFDFHVKTLKLSLGLLGSLQNVEQLFQVNAFIGYFNILLTNWHRFKQDQRNQNLGIFSTEEDASKLIDFESSLIACLYETKNVISKMDFQSVEQMERNFIKSMFQYAEFIYDHEKKMLFKLKKETQSSIISKEFLLFEQNVDLYFQLFRGEEEEIHSPENFGNQSDERDVEI